MGQQIDLHDFVKDLGKQNVIDLTVGCVHIADLIKALPITERMKIQARLNETIEQASDEMPFAAKFLLESVASSIERSDRPRERHNPLNDLNRQR